MKILLYLFILTYPLTSGEYKDNINLKEINNIVNSGKFDFIGQVELQDGKFLGSCIAINENTLLSNASLLHNVVTMYDTTINDGKQTVIKSEVDKGIYNKTEIKITMNDKIYTINKIIEHPKFVFNKEISVDVSMIILKENINTKFPQLPMQKLEKNANFSLIGFKNTDNKSHLVYGTNSVDTTYSADNFDYLEFDLDKSEPKSNKNILDKPTEFEFCPTYEDKGFALISINNNDIIINSLYLLKKNETTHYNKTYAIDLFDLKEWLSSNVVSQITN